MVWSTPHAATGGADDLRRADDQFRRGSARARQGADRRNKGCEEAATAERLKWLTVARALRELGPAQMTRDGEAQAAFVTRDRRHRASEAALQILYQWEVAKSTVDRASDTLFQLQWPDQGAGRGRPAGVRHLAGSRHGAAPAHHRRADCRHQRAVAARADGDYRSLDLAHGGMRAGSRSRHAGRRRNQ